MRQTMGVAILLASCAAAASVPRAPAPVREWKGNPVAQVRLEKTYGQLPLVFEPNRGQVDKRVSWLARCPGYTLFLTEREAVMALREGEDKPPSVVRMRLAGSQPWRTSEGLEPTGGISNYFIGNDPKKWRTNVPHYRQVKFTGVYAGIDLVFYGNPQRLEYDLVVQPGADPQQIRLAYEGVKRIEVDSDGDLVLTTHTGAEVRQQRPRVYQDIDGQKVEVASKYQIAPHNRVSFELARYDRSERLLIDPLVLVYSTYLGGSGMEPVFTGLGSQSQARFGGMAVDPEGFVYVAGTTSSADLPVTNAIQPERPGSPTSAFVAKLYLPGPQLIYATYLGGQDKHERGFDLDVNTRGEAYVVGRSLSPDFPTVNALQPVQLGREDGFLAKLSADGSSLIFSTFFGGNGHEDAYTIALDSEENIYLAGETGSWDLPLRNAFQSVRPGGLFDSWLAKLNSSATEILFATYVGGNGDDEIEDLAVDAEDSVLVTGYTSSSNFPTLNPVQQNYGGGTLDGFLMKFSAQGELLGSTYLGGGQTDMALAVAVDPEGGSFVTGGTDSVNFPVTSSAFQSSFAGIADAFVIRYGPALTNASYATYIGGSDLDVGTCIAVDGRGRAVVGGITASADLPVGTGSPFPSYRGGGDTFLVALDPERPSVAWGTFLGGTGGDMPYSLGLDSTDNLYVFGATESTDYPTQTPYQGTNQGLTDVFVTKLGEQVSPPDVVTTVSAASFVPGAPLAPESIASGFGQELATTTEVATTIPLPPTLANVTVNIKDSAGMERPAPLFFVSPGQINYLVPSGTMSGTAAVTVTSGTQVVASGTLQIEAVAPGVFTANADGQGVAAAVAARYAGDNSMSWDYVFQCGSTIGSCVPKPIDLGSETDRVYLQLYGTGIRGASSLSAVTAKIGGVDAPVEYAGPAPGFVGLDQVNVRLPRSLIGRGEVAVVLTVDGKTANTVTVNIK